MSFRITVPGQPQGKGRARFGNGRTYTPAKTVAYEGLIAYAGQQVMQDFQRTLIEGPIYLTVTAYFAFPKSMSAKKRQAKLVHWHTARPDGDNILKAACDGLNGIVWKDDCQVAFAKIAKEYADVPRLEIIVEPLL